MTTKRHDDNTTEFIQRRTRHWKTTIAGIGSIVCPLVAIFCPPEYAQKICAISSLFAGWGLMAAADGKNVK